jgi:hypothetical protein
MQWQGLKITSTSKLPSFFLESEGAYCISFRPNLSCMLLISNFNLVTDLLKEGAELAL